MSHLYLRSPQLYLVSCFFLAALNERITQNVFFSLLSLSYILSMSIMFISLLDLLGASWVVLWLGLIVKQPALCSVNENAICFFHIYKKAHLLHLLHYTKIRKKMRDCDEICPHFYHARFLSWEKKHYLYSFTIFTFEIYDASRNKSFCIDNFQSNKNIT